MSTTKKKAKAANKKAPTPQTLIQQVFALVKDFNCSPAYGTCKGREEVNLYPNNDNAEKISVFTQPIGPTQTLVEMHRIAGGEKEVTLNYISDMGVRSNIAALHVIKSEIRRYC